MAKHRLPSAEPDPVLAEPGGVSVRVLVFLSVAASLFITAVVWAVTSTPSGVRPPVTMQAAVSPGIPGDPSVSSASPSPSPSPSPAASSASPVPTRAGSPSARPRTSSARPGALTARFGGYPYHDWSTYYGTYSITNNGNSTVNGWTLVVTFQSGTRVNAVSGATSTQNGSTVTFRSIGRNVTLAPGHTVVVIFQATWSGSGGQPQSCTINGAPC